MDANLTNTPQPPASAASPLHASRAGAASPALLLACGNSLREDDGVGLQIAEAVEQLFPASRLRIVAAQQFTPEMAADVAATDLAIFVDASAGDDPGAIRVCSVAARPDSAETHRMDPPALLAMAESLCGHTPAHAFALTVGAGQFGYGTEIGGSVRQAIPRACRLVGNLLSAFSRTQA
ncbi:MAG TPA: hydrogenase maturation protease [Acidobacteriaceae bacterium]|jgi:hydrogenase maturation protease|nr:hydrogenase maturation protease [Acidobacteriaceae bacterium]